MGGYSTITVSLCDGTTRTSTSVFYRNVCLISVVFAFSVGLIIGLLIPFVCSRTPHQGNGTTHGSTVVVPETSAIRTVFLNNSYGFRQQTAGFPKVSFVEPDEVPGDSDEYVESGVYWSRKIEAALPEGYTKHHHKLWSDYLESAVAVKLENGCGRMQNRLVTFRDGLKGCVRYRQNTDQIQGELFSFYLAQLLNLPNLAPSTISVVDLQTKLWGSLRNEIGAAQWNQNRAVVLTQYISNLNTANIPLVFKPNERHLNRYDVVNMTKSQVEPDVLLRNLVELAQWSDLIIFDYLTANLDRIVNNLYNYQWNVNIMDAPAHNLAKKRDNDLLVFLDNESGLLHGYRLLKKYEIYHTVLLENLCLFRRSTADTVKRLKVKGDVGPVLRHMFEQYNSVKVKDVLPSLPEKSVKILNERIEKVYNQIVKCEAVFS